MLEAIKPFGNTFMVRIGKDEATTKRNEEGEVADDEASKYREVTPQDETMEDVATSTHPVSEDVDPREQSLPLQQKRGKKNVPKGRNIPRVDETDSGDDTSNS
ncbi:hypothetical protein GOBAR_DD08997 [Gossypium barbadense]|nr:hypothetical protein GOBAR_DD08997 [Gossypium barbadense]